MANRTRIALVTVIILVGCVFAIPHFRNPMGDRAKADSNAEAKTDVTDLTLKISSDDEKADNDFADPIALRDVDSLNKNSVLVQHPVAPPKSVRAEEWKFPPIAEFGAKRDATDLRSLEPARANPSDSGTRQVGLKPTRLIGEDIGQQMSQSNFNQRSSRRTTSQRFDSNLGNTVSTLTPQPLPNKNRFAASQSMKQNSQRAGDDANWHRVVNGDTLEKLSQQYYGTPQQALNIFEANRQALFNPAILPIGLDLKIPKQNAARPARQISAKQISTGGLQPLTPRPVRPVSLP